ncbi:MAG: glycosyltransferase family 9 protein [Cetobacterium sp.]
MKKSYIVEGINLYGVRFILKFFKNRFSQKNKVLIKSCDGIGDILVRTKLADMIIDKYGKENVYFLMQSHYTKIGDMLGYNTIGYSRKERKNFFYRLKKMYDLNLMGFSKYINIEFANDITVGNIFCNERIGKIDNHPQVKRNNKYYTNPIKIDELYVLEQITYLAKEIIDKSLNISDLIPNLREKFSIEEKDIVIAVGSTEKSRVCSPKLMIEYINILLEKYPEKNILLVGNGERQSKYADFLKEKIKDEKIKNLVNQTSLKEVFELVAKSYLFIGFESGLYNLCYSLRKNGIILFKERSGIFIHDVPWLKIIFPKNNNKIIKDDEYDGVGINSITKEEFQVVLEGFQKEVKYGNI